MKKWKITIETTHRGKVTKTEEKIVESSREPKVGECIMKPIDPPIYETITKVEEVTSDELSKSFKKHKPKDFDEKIKGLISDEKIKSDMTLEELHDWFQKILSSNIKAKRERDIAIWAYCRGRGKAIKREPLTPLCEHPECRVCRIIEDQMGKSFIKNEEE